MAMFISWPPRPLMPRLPFLMATFYRLFNPVTLNIFGSRDRIPGRQFFQRWVSGWGWGAMQVMGNGCKYRRSLASHLWLATFTPSHLLTGHRPVPVHGLGYWGPLLSSLHTNLLLGFPFFNYPPSATCSCFCLPHPGLPT